MATEVIMPALGMAQETGVLVEWFKAEGEAVVQGEPLMEVETDKAAVEIEAPASGVLGRVTARPGDEIPVGQVIALILRPGEAATKELPAREGSVAAGSPVAAGPAPAERREVPVGPPEARTAAGPVRPPEVGTSRPAATPAAAARREAPVNPPEVRTAPLPRLETGPAPPAITPGPVADRKEPVSPPAGGAGGRAPASPKARRLAQEQGLELRAIAGSGPEGAVLAADVLAAARRAPEEAALPPAAGGEFLSVSHAWKVMVARLTQSWTQAPHFYLTAEAGAGELRRWLDEARQRGAEGITYTDLFVKIAAAALHRHPRLNGRWESGGIVLDEEINVGLAVAVEEGLVVPVVRRANRLNLKELAERRKELIERARSGKLLPEDLRGGTFTISNLGMYGVDAFNAIVNPPQAAILALGRIADRVVPVDGQPAVRPMVTLTLSCDHRVVDGARAAQFLQTLVELIESPLQLLLVG